MIVTFQIVRHFPTEKPHGIHGRKSSEFPRGGVDRIDFPVELPQGVALVAGSGRPIDLEGKKCW